MKKLLKKTLILALRFCQNWYQYWVKFLTIFGNIKVFKTPCWVIYTPEEYDYRIRGNVIRDIDALLQPGDIVLRNYDHYLDALVIPGEYSHSGIYVGNHKIVHAIAKGVQFIDVIDFFQCDQACILRPKVEQSVKDKAVERANKWVGVAYDFKFNSSDSSAFYCNELTAMCYSGFIEIKKFYPVVFDKQLKILNQKYLSKSFLTNDAFEKVFEIK